MRQKKRKIKPLSIVSSQTVGQGNQQHQCNIQIAPPLRVGVFFDGTGNNDDNRDKFSNVKYLYDMYQGDGAILDAQPTLRKFYQRGVGSHEDDSLFESAAGWGAEQRFDNVIFHIEKYIKEYLLEMKNCLPRKLQLDVFGFSRGAAMARHFVNCMKQNHFDFSDAEIDGHFNQENTEIHFLGVFDTVGSFGKAGDNVDKGYGFYIKPEWIMAKAVHIYALNEYRANFDVQTLFETQDTNYPIDIDQGPLKEIGYPGVHSDVGGGYLIAEEEQYANNSLLAAFPLRRMTEEALAVGVPLDNYSDDHRIQAGNKLPERDFFEVDRNLAKVMIYLEQSSLRAAIGKWRELIAWNDIYRESLKNPAMNSSVRRATHRQIRYLERDIALERTQLMSLFPSEEKFEEFEAAYRVLYTKYMHRSHGPFNTTFGMWTEKADSCFFGCNTHSGRPHRDIFLKPYIDFDVENRLLHERQKKRQRGGRMHFSRHDLHEVGECDDLYRILQSVYWNDPTRN